jgi:hypothetical protein
MHSQVTQPGPRGAWRGTDRSGGSRGPRSRTSRTRGRSPAPSWPPRSAPTPPAARGIVLAWGDKDRDPDVVHLRQRRTRPQEVAVLTDALVQPPVLDVHGGPWLRVGWDWIPRRSSPTAATCAFGERKGEPRLGSVPTRRPRRQTAQDFVLVRTPPQAVPTLRPWRAPSDRRCRAHRSTCQSAVGGEFSNFCFRLVSMSCRISAKPRWG